MITAFVLSRATYPATIGTSPAVWTWTQMAVIDQNLLSSQRKMNIKLVAWVRSSRQQLSVAIPEDILKLTAVR